MFWFLFCECYIFYITDQCQEWKKIVKCSSLIVVFMHENGLLSATCHVHAERGEYLIGLFILFIHLIFIYFKGIKFRGD